MALTTIYRIEPCFFSMKGNLICAIGILCFSLIGLNQSSLTNEEKVHLMKQSLSQFNQKIDSIITHFSIDNSNLECIQSEEFYESFLSKNQLIEFNYASWEYVESEIDALSPSIFEEARLLSLDHITILDNLETGEREWSEYRNRGFYWTWNQDFQIKSIPPQEIDQFLDKYYNNKN